MSASEPAPLLRIESLGKSFPGVKALNGVSFSVRRGSIHALMGENGAGKSTLIKILAGIYRCDEGTVLLDGAPLEPRSPAEAQARGISVVHQEIKLAETLSVAENIFLGAPPMRRGLVDWAAMRARAKELLDRLGSDIGVDHIVGELSIAKKQIVEICKAIHRDCRLLVMDEPSATLTDREMIVLYDIIGRLAAGGVTILYISHRMDEIFRLCNDVTVLRDGRHVATLPLASCDRASIIGMMVGRSLDKEFPKEAVPLGETILEVSSLSRAGAFSDVSFSLRRGEILGFAGLVGAGRTEVARALLGIDRATGGTVRLRGRPVRHASFKAAIRNGLSLVPEDRKTQGLVLRAPLKDNICMVAMRKILRRGVVDRKAERRYAEVYVARLAIATPGIDTEVQYLSGGNQQKVVIAKWLMEDGDIIVMDEPTRGVDVGAKYEIYRLMVELARSGKSIVMISSELPEILGMCDRLVVMHEGRKVGEMDAAGATQERIMGLCV